MTEDTLDTDGNLLVGESRYPEAGEEVLVDVSPYTRPGSVADLQWCVVTHVSGDPPGSSASVYPIKALVPGLGSGQWKLAEVRGHRVPAGVLRTLDALQGRTAS